MRSKALLWVATVVVGVTVAFGFLLVPSPAGSPTDGDAAAEPVDVEPAPEGNETSEAPAPAGSETATAERPPSVPVATSDAVAASTATPAATADSSGPSQSDIPPTRAVAAQTSQAAPGRMVWEVAPNYAAAGNSNVFHGIHLPTNWQDGRTYPVIVEYAPNRWNQNGKFGLDGTQRTARMGYALSEGRDYIWIVMPIVDSKGTPSLSDDTNSVDWWGQPTADATVAYVKDHLRSILDAHGGDPNNVTLVGFSRGAVATNYVGLADDEIAGYWKAFYAAEHYDGVHAGWPYAGADAGAARQRLARLRGRPQLVTYLDEGLTGDVRSYLDRELPGGNITFMPLTSAFFGQHQSPGGHPTHHIDWMYTDNDKIREARAWLRSVTGGSRPTAPNPSPPADDSEGGQGAEVTFYADGEYGGASWSVPAGTYDYPAVAASPVGNDRISSFRIPDGMSVTVCKHSNADGRGQCETFGASLSTLPVMDDEISWVQVSNASAPPLPPSLQSPPEPPSQPNQGPSTNGVTDGDVYLIRSVASGRCIDVPPPAKVNGTAVHLWDCSPTLNRQQWRFEATGDGHFRIVSVNSGKVLSLDDPADVNGSQIMVWDDQSRDRQQWRPELLDSGAYRLNARSGAWKTVTVSGTDNGASITGWGINPGGLDRQYWELVPA